MTPNCIPIFFYSQVEIVVSNKIIIIIIIIIITMIC